MTTKKSEKNIRIQETKALIRGITERPEDSQNFDLHIHSTVSDGSDGFKEIIRQAKSLGISTIAFTNHDTTVGLDYAIDLGMDYGIQVIGGVEISAYDPCTKKRIHILGYGLTSSSPAITALCRPVLERRSANTHRQMKRLIDGGYTVDVEKVLGHARLSTAFYKQHLMTGLTDAPHESDSYKMLYTSLFKGGGIAACDIEYVAACDAIGAIVNDGGVPVLAHPGQLHSYEFVPALVECGLQGIEKYHPDHTEQDINLCSELQEKYELIATGGSDYHGIFGSIPSIGLSRERELLLA